VLSSCVRDRRGNGNSAGFADGLQEKTAGAGSPGTKGPSGLLFEPPLALDPSRDGSPAPPVHAMSMQVSTKVTLSEGLGFIDQ
jgi:hypothetical protein